MSEKNSQCEAEGDPHMTEAPACGNRKLHTFMVTLTKTYDCTLIGESEAEVRAAIRKEIDSGDFDEMWDHPEQWVVDVCPTEYPFVPGKTKHNGGVVEGRIKSELEFVEANKRAWIYKLPATHPLLRTEKRMAAIRGSINTANEWEETYQWAKLLADGGADLWGQRLQTPEALAKARYVARVTRRVVLCQGLPDGKEWVYLRNAILIMYESLR